MAITLNGTTGITTPAIDNQGNLSVDGGTIKLDGNYPVGANNVALGDAALASGSLSGGDNTAVGFQALTTNTSGEINTAVGSDALRYNTTGGHNTSLGVNALKQNTSGNYHTAVGKSALESNTTADSNNAFGRNALFTNTTGAQNVALGYLALYLNTTASYNTAVGNQALQNNTTGANNTSLGFLSLYANTTGSQNVALGTDALQQNTTSSENTALGYQAGYGNTTGSANVFIGRKAGHTNTTSGAQTMVGTGAGQTTTGQYNTFIGNTAGYHVSSGQKNTILGRYDGNQGGLDIRTASNHIVLSDGDGNPRMDTDASGVSSFRSSIDRCVGVNNGTYTWFMGSNGSNQMTFYDGAGTLRGYLTLGGTWTDTSDLAFKTNITDLSYGLAEVERLQPRSYFMKETPDSDPQIGFIAQEVELVIPEVVSGEEGSKGIGYGRLTAILVKAIQEQQATITALTARITALEGA
jgi:trimeric autotransporter adhesin